MAFDVSLKSGPSGTRLYVPEGENRPAVLMLHGSEGGYAGWSHLQAFRFASSGFCAVAANYSIGGNLWHAGDIRNVELSSTETLLRSMKESPFTTGQIGLYGASRGAEHALVLTSMLVRDESDVIPDAVAVHSPPDTIADAFVSRDFNPNDHEVWDPSRRPWQWRGSSEGLYPTTPIEIERYPGPLFISHGEQDCVWTVECTRRLETRLINAKRSPEIHYYPQEDHSLSADAENLQHDRLVSFFLRAFR